MREMEVALQGVVIDPDSVSRLGASVGEIEAKMTRAQAQAMLNVRNLLSAEQLDALLDMRATYTVAKPKGAALDPVDHGRQLFAQCVLCHTPSRENAVMPNLAGVIGRPMAGDAGYSHYSPALLGFARSQGRWDTDSLDMFLKSPRALVPGTTMGGDGFEDATDRAAILSYIATLD